MNETLIITFSSSLKGGDLRAANIGLNTLACILIKAKNCLWKGCPTKCGTTGPVSEKKLHFQNKRIRLVSSVAALVSIYE